MISSFRPNGHIQSFSYGEHGSPSLDLHGGYAQHMSKPPHFMPHFPQNSPSRLGQQPVQRFNHGGSTAVRGTEWNHLNIQVPPSSFNSGGPRSPGNNGMSWGTSLFLTTFTFPNTSVSVFYFFTFSRESK